MKELFQFALSIAGRLSEIIEGVAVLWVLFFALYSQTITWWREPKIFTAHVALFIKVVFWLVSFVLVLGGIGFLIDYLGDHDHFVLRAAGGLISCFIVVPAFYFGIKYIVTVFSRK